MSVELLIANFLRIAAEDLGRTKRIPRAPAIGDVRSALDAAALALHKAIKHFKVDIELPDSPAGFAGPVR